MQLERFELYETQTLIVKDDSMPGHRQWNAIEPQFLTADQMAERLLVSLSINLLANTKHCNIAI
jgi:hypothetical protein